MERISETNESPEQVQEKIITQVISHVTSKIEEAVKLYRESKVNGNSTDIVEYLQKIWPENDGVPWQRRPRFTVPDLEDPIQVRFESQSTEYEISSRTMRLAIGPLRSATNPEEFEQALKHLTQSVYHESEHIFNPGMDLDSEEGAKGVVEYLCNEGEIAAHARQYTYRYMKEYPGQSFDIELMQKLARKLNEEESDHNIYSYFILFPDPSKQEKYKEYGDILKAYTQIVEIMNRSVV